MIKTKGKMYMVEEIFEKIVLESPEWRKPVEAVEREIEKAMVSMGEGKSDAEREKIRDRFYGVAYAAEKSAFEVGFRYAEALLLSKILSQDSKESE